MKKVVIIFLFIICFNKVYALEELKEIECVDGDTIRAVIDGNKETIRFLAIDTPETKYSTKEEAEPYSVDASEYTCNKVMNGKVEIEYDENSDEKDKYGRVLGWIYVDNELLQKELVKEGLAKVKYIYNDYKYVSDLEELEKYAKENKLGIWSDYEEEESLIDKIIDKIVALMKKIFEKIYEFIENLLKD